MSKTSLHGVRNTWNPGKKTAIGESCHRDPRPQSWLSAIVHASIGDLNSLVRDLPHSDRDPTTGSICFRCLVPGADLVVGRLSEWDTIPPWELYAKGHLEACSNVTSLCKGLLCGLPAVGVDKGQTTPAGKEQF